MSLPSMITFCVFARFCCNSSSFYALPELRRLQMPYFPPLHFSDVMKYPFRSGNTCCTASSYAIVTSASLHASITSSVSRGWIPYPENESQDLCTWLLYLHKCIPFLFATSFAIVLFPAPAGPSIATLYPMVPLSSVFIFYFIHLRILFLAAYAVDQAI